RAAEVIQRTVPCLVIDHAAWNFDAGHTQEKIPVAIPFFDQRRKIVAIPRAKDDVFESRSTGPGIELVEDRIGSNRGDSERETFDWIRAAADHPGGFLRLLSRCTGLS